MLVLLKETEMANPTPEGARRGIELYDLLQEGTQEVLEARKQLLAAENKVEQIERERIQVYRDLGANLKPPQQPKIAEEETPPQVEKTLFSFENNHHTIPAWSEKRSLIVAGVAAAAIIALLWLPISFFPSKTDTSEIFVGKVVALSGEIKGVARQVTVTRQEVGVIGETALRIEKQNNDLKNGFAEIKKGISSKLTNPIPASKTVAATKTKGSGTEAQNSSLEICNLKVVDIRDQRKVLGFVVVKEVEGKIFLSKQYVLSNTSPSQGTKHTTWTSKGTCLANKTLVKESWSTVISDLRLFFESKPL